MWQAWQAALLFATRLPCTCTHTQTHTHTQTLVLLHTAGSRHSLGSKSHAAGLGSDCDGAACAAGDGGHSKSLRTSAMHRPSPLYVMDR